MIDSRIWVIACTEIISKYRIALSQNSWEALKKRAAHSLQSADFLVEACATEGNCITSCSFDFKGMYDQGILSNEHRMAFFLEHGYYELDVDIIGTGSMIHTGAAASEILSALCKSPYSSRYANIKYRLAQSRRREGEVMRREWEAETPNEIQIEKFWGKAKEVLSVRENSNG
jgi:hypothetical protein